MPRPLILRLKRRNTSKRNQSEQSGDAVYLQLLLKFHDNLFSIVKSLFTCLFVFAATPLALLARNDFKQYKENISTITSMICEIMIYCLALFLMYALFAIFFDLKSRTKKYLTERLKYVNVSMVIISFALISIVMVRYFIYFSSLLKIL